MGKNPFWKSLEVIWNNPKYVFIDKMESQKVAEDWAKNDFPVPSWEDAENPYDFLEFMGLASSVNFCYCDPYDPEMGRYFFNWRGEKYEGAYGMSVALRTAMERGIPLFNDKGFINCDFLQNITGKNVWDIFCKDFEIPLVSKRMFILKEIGFGLHNECGGRFRSIFEDGAWSAFGAKNRRGIIDILISIFPSFEDVGIYRSGFLSEVVCFYKRAQLFLMIYQGRAMARNNYKQINDYELLGPPTDYELPKALRHLGILEYHLSLSDKIDKKRIIMSGSLEEQEIRAQTVNAMLQLLDGINALRSNNKINMLGLDYKMWNTGRNIKNTPHHLTPTIAY